MNLKQNGAAINVYPNPTAGEFIIELHLPSAKIELEISWGKRYLHKLQIL